MSEGSLVHFSSRNFSLSAETEERSFPHGNEHLLNWARKEYGAVTSFTELKIARNIYIKVGEGKFYVVSINDWFMTVSCFLFGDQVARARNQRITDCWTWQGPEGSLGPAPHLILSFPFSFWGDRPGKGGEVGSSLVERGGSRWVEFRRHPGTEVRSEWKLTSWGVGKEGLTDGVQGELASWVSS